MKYVICLIIQFALIHCLHTQSNLPNNSLGLSFIQLQSNSNSYGFRLTPILNIGLSYEHTIGENSTLLIEGMYKSGTNRMGCIDCFGASGKMKEYNLKIGANRYSSINEKFTLFGQVKLFYEKTNVPSGIHNWHISNEIFNDWYRYVEFYGVELSMGLEYKIFKSISAYVNPSLQYGNYSEENPVFDDREVIIFNWVILENVGVKYRF